MSYEQRDQGVTLTCVREEAFTCQVQLSHHHHQSRVGQHHQAGRVRRGPAPVGVRTRRQKAATGEAQTPRAGVPPGAASHDVSHGGTTVTPPSTDASAV